MESTVWLRMREMCACMMFWWVAVRGRLRFAADTSRHGARVGNGVSGTAKCVDECDLYKRLTLQDTENTHETAADKLQLGRREAAQAFTRTRRLCLRWPRPSPLSA